MAVEEGIVVVFFFLFFFSAESTDETVEGGSIRFDMVMACSQLVSSGNQLRQIRQSGWKTVTARVCGQASGWKIARVAGQE